MYYRVIRDMPPLSFQTLRNWPAVILVSWSHNSRYALNIVHDGWFVVMVCTRNSGVNSRQCVQLSILEMLNDE